MDTSKETTAFVEKFVSDFFEALPAMYGREPNTVQRDVATACGYAVSQLFERTKGSDGEVKMTPLSLRLSP